MINPISSQILATLLNIEKMLKPDTPIPDPIDWKDRYFVSETKVKLAQIQLVDMSLTQQGMQRKINMQSNHINQLLKQIKDLKS